MDGTVAVASLGGRHFRNPTRDTALRMDECHSFPAPVYVSTPAGATARRCCKKVPAGDEKAGEIFKINDGVTTTFPAGRGE
jgi:hypothetical protein